MGYKFIKWFFFGFCLFLLYYFVVSYGNVYKYFVVFCFGEEVVNVVSVINVNKGLNVYSIKIWLFF